MTKDEEYCEECGDAEFDADGNETHADEDEYDHDFEYEEEDEGTTLDDVKEFADTVKSLAEAGKSVKELTKPSITSHINLDSDRFKQKRFEVPPPYNPHDYKMSEHPDKKAERRHKENLKWTKIGIGVGAIVAVILGTVAIIFN